MFMVNVVIGRVICGSRPSTLCAECIGETTVNRVPRSYRHTARVTHIRRCQVEYEGKDLGKQYGYLGHSVPPSRIILEGMCDRLQRRTRARRGSRALILGRDFLLGRKDSPMECQAIFSEHRILVWPTRRQPRQPVSSGYLYPWRHEQYLGVVVFAPRYAQD